MSNESSRVAEWNMELTMLLIPDDVILSLYILLGITGNTLVILVYRFRMRKQSEDRYFIPALAFSDLCASVICASFGIALNLMQAEFTNNNLCKAWWFFAAFSTYLSILLLTIIAVHRYLKVCRPLGRQMSLFWKRFAIGLAFCISIILGGPTTALYGSVEFPNLERNIVGRRCSKLKNVSKAGSLAYGAVAILVAIGSVSVLIGFYGHTGWTIYKHFRYMSKKSTGKVEHATFTGESKSGDTKETISSDLENSAYKISSPKFSSYENTKKAVTTISANEETSMEMSETRSDDKNLEKAKRKTKTNNGKEESNRKVMYKFTIMFIVITIIFLICYIPKVFLLLIEGLNPQFWENFTDSQRAGMLFLYRSYIINNIANPFIYAFMDTKFRNEAKLLLRCSK